jgi:lipoyl(octanoyl) transferase
MLETFLFFSQIEAERLLIMVPGQLVIYFLLDIKKSSLGPKTLVKTLQEFTKSLLEHYSIDSNFVDGAPGVYVDNKKIASIGLQDFEKAKPITA